MTNEQVSELLVSRIFKVLIFVNHIVPVVMFKIVSKVWQANDHPLSKEQTTLVGGVGVNPISGAYSWRAFKFPKGD